MQTPTETTELYICCKKLGGGWVGEDLSFPILIFYLTDFLNI